MKFSWAEGDFFKITYILFEYIEHSFFSFPWQIVSRALIIQNGVEVLCLVLKYFSRSWRLLTWVLTFTIKRFGERGFEDSFFLSPFRNAFDKLPCDFSRGSSGAWTNLHLKLSSHSTISVAWVHRHSISIHRKSTPTFKFSSARSGCNGGYYLKGSRKRNSPIFQWQYKKYIYLNKGQTILIKTAFLVSKKTI